MYKAKNTRCDVSKHRFLTIFFAHNNDGSRDVFHSNRGCGVVCQCNYESGWYGEVGHRLCKMLSLTYCANIHDFCQHVCANEDRKVCWQVLQFEPFLAALLEIRDFITKHDISYPVRVHLFVSASGTSSRL